MQKLFCAIGMLAVLVVPAGSAVASCPVGTAAWQETQMFFGRGLKGGGEVSDSEWGVFVRDEITPRFPDGFTVVDAAGFWRGCPSLPSGVCERSKLLLVQYPAEMADADTKLKAIATTYAGRFHQQAVMRSDSSVCTQFYSADE
ncbi:DUF3574 domain-containing protein [Kordiimonas pumila]|uniref:DUF3574 domain-containing protein n=1 Tax=Kordiimonas pumila TaxID=2161677 RepID=A0ABV7D1J3_9PROT|nr:DUF3574 domain-containing protein [Kordiimonas pumila]